MKNYHLYFGRAGQLKVMSDFLLKGWNVSTPEVDIGDDIFIIRDDRGEYRRIQIKTATAVKRKDFVLIHFLLPVNQIKIIKTESIFYFVFQPRLDNEWLKPIIISQDKLLFILDLVNLNLEREKVNLYFKIQSNKVFLQDIDVTEYQNNYSDFPDLFEELDE